MEYTPYISESITRKVSLVVLPIDDFTGKPILGSNVRVYIDGAPKAIKKDDGYHVFVNINQPKVTVQAEGGLYNPRSLECNLSANEDHYTLIKLRMVPNRSYPIPRDTTCVEGKAFPNSSIRVFCRDNGAYKLLYDYKKENSPEAHPIFIFHPNETDLEGKLLYITGSESKNGEYMRIAAVADKENKEYILEKGLTSGYKKIGTSLYSVFETFADKNGSFFLPITGTFKEKNAYICEAYGERIVSVEIDLVSGKVNKVDLVDG